MKSPVLFVVFNRPATTAKVFEEIRKARPKSLYIAADGPRPSREDDRAKCEEVRRIVSGVDWECDVKTRFLDSNVGCKTAVSGAIDWFFAEEPEGIILEDDCLPSTSFFRYCDEMLEKFRDDQRVFLVSGYNKQQRWKRDEADYFFSYYGGIWGWASWRRAWRHNDIEMADLEDFVRAGKLVDLLGEKQGRIREAQLRNVQVDSRLSAWDYQWGYSRHRNSAFACVPSVSLIENIGFGEDATHTFANYGVPIRREDLDFPLRENRFVVVDRAYDDAFFPPAGAIDRIRLAVSKVKSFIIRSKKGES